MLLHVQPQAMMIAVLLGMAGCPGPTTDTETGDSETGHTGETAPEPGPAERTITVTVTLDGAPATNTRVLQAGTKRHWETDASGNVTCDVDMRVPGGDIYLAASHPEARIGSVQIKDETPNAVTIALVRYVHDNPEYLFGDPGTPDRRGTTAQCAHCHVSFNDAWYASPHRTTASNPIVQLSLIHI